MRTCPDCNASVSDSANFCDNCGYPFQSAPAAPPPGPSAGASPFADPLMKPQGPPAPAPGATGGVPAGMCAACGYQNIPGEMFCNNCGVQLAPVASTPPPPPRPQTGPRPSAPPAPTPSAPAPQPAGPRSCPECGSEASARDVFCQNCGAMLPKVAVPSAPAQLSGPAQQSSGPEMPTEIDVSPAPSSPPAPTPSAPRSPAPSSMPQSSAPFSAGQSEPARPPSPAPSIPSQPSASPSSAPPSSPGRFVVRETGKEIVLPGGKTEMIIGRSDPVREIYPEVDLSPHGGDTHGVSRRHARLAYANNSLQIEDLNSTNFTFINRQRVQPGQLMPLRDGDEVRLGLLALEYHQK